MTSTSIKDRIKMDNLALLHGKPILIPDTPINVFPVKLRDISSVGVEKFFFFLGLTTINPLKSGQEFLVDTDFSDSEKSLLYLLAVLKDNRDFERDFCNALNFFLKTKVGFNKEEMYLWLKPKEEEIVVTVEVFEALQYIIKRQNFLLKEKEEFKPLNDKAAEIVGKMNKGRAKVGEIKSKNSETTDFSDLVSGLAAKGNGLSIFNIWNLSYYAFNDQLKRMGMIEEYETGLQSIMAGADSKKVKLKYWIRNIQSE